MKYTSKIVIYKNLSHSLRGLCGLKCYNNHEWQHDFHRHSLRGLCGLKFSINQGIDLYTASQPARAVWIEIHHTSQTEDIPQSQPARAVWIEIASAISFNLSIVSQPARAVWIEILVKKEFETYQKGHSLRGLCGLK